MDEPALDAWLQAADKARQQKIYVNDLKIQRLDVTSQIEKQEAEHPARSEHAKLSEELHIKTTQYRKIKTNLESQVEKLGDEHRQFVSDAEKRLAAFKQDFEAQSSELRKKKQKIEDDILEGELQLKNLFQRHGNAGLPQLAPPLVPEDSQEIAVGKIQPTPSGRKRPLANVPSITPSAEQLVRVKSLTEAFPLVVKFGREWCEIACCICGANRGRDHARFFGGWANLRRHLIRAHEDDVLGISDKDLLKACIQRRFSPVDAKRMRRGQDPLEGGPIRKVQQAQWDEQTRLAGNSLKPVQSHASGDSEEDDVNIPGRHHRPATTVKRQELNDRASEQDDRNSDEDDEPTVDESNFGIEFDEEEDDDESSAPGNIIQLKNGGIAKISCNYCGANASAETEEFFEGVEGMLDHLLACHRDNLPAYLSHEAIAEHYHVAKISIEELELIAVGELPNKQIYGTERNKSAVEDAHAQKMNNEASRRSKMERQSQTTKMQAAAPMAQMMTPSHKSQLQESRQSFSAIKDSLGHGQTPQHSAMPPSSQWLSNASRQHRDKYSNHAYLNAMASAHAGGQNGSTPGRKPLTTRSPNSGDSPPRKRARKSDGGISGRGVKNANGTDWAKLARR